MSHKSLAIGTAVIVVSLITLMTFLVASSTLQAINPTAALTAVVVALIGIAWFKKTIK